MKKYIMPIYDGILRGSLMWIICGFLCSQNALYSFGMDLAVILEAILLSFVFTVISHFKDNNTHLVIGYLVSFVSFIVTIFLWIFMKIPYYLFEIRELGNGDGIWLIYYWSLFYVITFIWRCITFLFCFIRNCKRSKHESDYKTEIGDVKAIIMTPVWDGILRTIISAGVLEYTLSIYASKSIILDLIVVFGVSIIYAKIWYQINHNVKQDILRKSFVSGYLIYLVLFILWICIKICMKINIFIPQKIDIYFKFGLWQYPIFRVFISVFRNIGYVIRRAMKEKSN